MTLKDLIFTPSNRVYLNRVSNGSIVYHLKGDADTVLLEFSIPPEDQLGATFELIDTPKMFMRWIRKELDRQEEEKKTIEQARKDWAEGKQY